MVTPIDAVRYGVGFSEARSRYDAGPLSVARRRAEWEDPLSTARGMVLGLILSAGLWVGLFGAVRAAIALLGRS